MNRDREDNRMEKEKQSQAPFYKGMDISFLPQCLDEGMQVYDLDGTAIEPFALLRKYGVNAVRLRLWNEPERIPEAKGYCNFRHTLDMAKKIKENGMDFMLDFHYSDFWADPGQQNKPKAWEKLSFAKLEQAVYDFTAQTLQKLEQEGVLPQVVQIGNEIRSGLLFPDGELPDYEHMVRLVNAGIRGARSVADKNRMKVMIHLDQGGRYFYLKEWFAKAFDAGLEDFDVMGLSYYPFWHGTFADLKETMEKLVAEYHKPIMIVETAHAWRKSKQGFIDEAQEKIAGFPASPKGQKCVLELVANIVASLSDNMGQGFFYWEPMCVPKAKEGGWAQNMGLLEEDGRVMEGIEAFRFRKEQCDFGRCAKIYEPKEMTIVQGMIPSLPEELSVLFMDGRIHKKSVVWKLPEKLEVGDYQIKGSIPEIAADVYAKVSVVSEPALEENLLQDSNWDSGMAMWNITNAEEGVISQIIPAFEAPFPAPPVNALRVEGKRNFNFTISQQIQVAQAGKYCLCVESRGTDTTNVDIRLFVKQGNMEKEIMLHPTEHAWEESMVKDIPCEQGRVTVGIKIQSPPNYTLFRKFRFFQKTERD